MNKKLIAIPALIFTSLLSAHAAPLDYAVQQHWTLDGAGRWDYAAIDPVRHRLFIARGERVQVLALPSGQAAGAIEGTSGVHGVAFAEDLKLGFTSNGKSNTVTVFDLATLAVKQQIAVSGLNPDAILYVPETRTLYTFNGKSANISVIDAVTLKEKGTIAVTGKPEFAVSDHKEKIFVNIEDTNELAVIDTAARKMVAHWPLAGCEEPSGIAMDVQHARVFSVCKNNQMMVTDAATGANVAKVAIGPHPDAAAYDPATATVFSSNGDAGGTVTVIHQSGADSYAVQQNVVTLPGARTMALDAATHTLYLPALTDGVFGITVVAPK